MNNQSGSLRTDFTKDGYSQEEKYFYELNQELIERRRSELDLSRKLTRLNEDKSQHWMKCPKCGSALNETSMLGICLEQCTGCQGVFLDSGELVTLLAAKQPLPFLNRLKSLFKKQEGAPLLF